MGLFINTLPVVCTPRPGQAVGDWLRELQAQNDRGARARAHAALRDPALGRIRAGPGLFDTIVVFENYPADQALRENMPGGMTVDVIGVHEETHYLR